ncbi:MAG: hypothetical protein PHV06_03415 [bacterium]|nr:hypothetical protein [bacterium]
MGHAYTPGLKVARSSVVKKERILPLKGNILVNEGDIVDFDKIVAKTELPGNITAINIANRLNVLPSELHEFMMKKEGDPITKDETIALSKGFFGLFKSFIKSPIDGSVESISTVTGQVMLREHPIPVQVKAYIKGKVTKIFPTEGVEVETPASFIQGIFGIGGETNGELILGVEKPSDILDENDIKPEFKDKIIIGGALVTSAALKKAIAIGARGVITGGFDDKDLREFLGYELGVAITGSENLGITLILTEGFGTINMADKTFNLLKSRQGFIAAINGATQIRAGVIRPEIIIPLEKLEEGKAVDIQAAGILKIGTPIRIIREPNFGHIAKVISLPVELVTLESETKVRIVEVELFESGEKLFLPRANIEIIED